MDKIINKLQAKKRRDGQHHADCPFCRKEMKRNQTHFSFSDKGYYCFVCGAGGSIHKLAAQLELPTTQYNPKPKSKPAEHKPFIWHRSVLERFLVPERFKLWRAYKPLSRELIQRFKLGVGTLPRSACTHQRLIVPIIYRDEITGFRGRRMACSCAKWLVSAKTSPKSSPLYGIELAPHWGGVFVICENPIDALLVSQQTEFAGVATYSTSYWEDEWTNDLINRKPSLVMVCYDNDMAGKTAGIRLANRLSKKRIPVRMMDWKDAPEKHDIGSMILAGA